MGAWQEIADYTVPSNTTSVVLDSFGTITKDDFIRIESTIVNNSTSTDIAIFANTATTQTQYHTQLLISGGSTVLAVRTNTNRAIRSRALRTGTTFSYLKLSQNDRLNIFSNYNMTTTSTDIDNGFPYVTSSGATFPSGITSLTFTADATNGIGTGSRIQIYKLAAEKVADITVGSNTTQVDISNLSIDKDSEYLLVSDILAGATASDINLTPNDLTTLTNYYSQAILAGGSTVEAFRRNQPYATFTNPPGDFIAYTYIKLSNIGTFTFQSYQIRKGGSSSIELTNYFTSSTSEAITSITKLNIIGITNTIGAGSTFTLYKLY